MEITPKLTTWNVKKTQRFEAKKRKIEALLNLFGEDEKKLPVKRKKEPESLVESYKALKDVLKLYNKKTVEPFFCLTPCGLKAKVNLELKESEIDSHLEGTETLFSEDVYSLLLLSVIGHMSPYPVRWTKLKDPQTLSRTVLLVIEGLSMPSILGNISKLSNIPKIFSHAVRIVTPNVPFSVELATLHQDLNYHIQGEDTYLSIFPKTSEVKVKMSETNKTPSKLHLLLSPIQLVMENYPLPGNVFQHSKSENYVFTHRSYSPVSKNSPLFAIDCEMCRTENGRNELTRVAIVDESLDVIYHTFVKPEAKIVDYMTKFSGITKGMLTGVNTRLKEVQTKIQAILPKDAILCGQSLNCDMRALQMIHPYIIDTSIIFNGSGIRGRKDSLKKLASYHLNEEIQSKKSGHDPVEDAITTMKLVQLKLNNSIEFGDACLDNKISKGESNETWEDSKLKKAGKCDEIHKDDKSNILKDKGFFAQLAKFSKNTCLIGGTESLNNYPPEVFHHQTVHKIAKPNKKKISKSTLKHINSYDLTISHLIFDSIECEESSLELNNLVKQIYDCCPDKSLFMILFSGVDETKGSTIKNGLLMTALKKVK